MQNTTRIQEYKKIKIKLHTSKIQIQKNCRHIFNIFINYFHKFNSL